MSIQYAKKGSLRVCFLLFQRGFSGIYLRFEISYKMVCP